MRDTGEAMSAMRDTDPSRLILTASSDPGMLPTERFHLQKPTVRYRVTRPWRFSPLSTLIITGVSLTARPSHCDDTRQGSAESGIDLRDPGY